LEPFLDYILYNPEYNDGVLFSEFLAGNIGIPITLNVYNLANQEVRQVSVIPKLLPDKTLTGAARFLGAHCRFEQYDNVSSMVMKVADIQHKSPAYMSDLIDPRIGGETFILGTREKNFESVDEFQELLYARNGYPLEIVTYNTMEGVAKLTKVVPNTNWGGEGILGCAILSGALHKIPKRAFVTKEKLKEQQLLEQSEEEEEEEEEVVKQEPHLSDDSDEEENKAHQDAKHNFHYVNLNKSRPLEPLDTNENNKYIIEHENENPDVIFHREHGKQSQFLLLTA